MENIREANFERLCTTLMNQKGDAVPLIELGIDSSIKEKILQRPFEIHSIAEYVKVENYLAMIATTLAVG